MHLLLLLSPSSPAYAVTISPWNAPTHGDVFLHRLYTSQYGKVAVQCNIRRSKHKERDLDIGIDLQAADGGSAVFTEIAPRCALASSAKHSAEVTL